VEVLTCFLVAFLHLLVQVLIDGYKRSVVFYFGNPLLNAPARVSGNRFSYFISVLRQITVSAINSTSTNSDILSTSM